MLATSRLKLRKFGNADTARVAEICGDYRVASMCRVVPHPYDVSSASFFINTVCTQMDGLVLAIETLADGKLVFYFQTYVKMKQLKDKHGESVMAPVPESAGEEFKVMKKWACKPWTDEDGAHPWARASED